MHRNKVIETKNTKILIFFYCSPNSRDDSYSREKVTKPDFREGREEIGAYYEDMKD